MTDTAPTFGQAAFARSGNGQAPEFLEATDLLGSMGFADAFPGPTKMQLDGKEYTLTPLTNDDYTDWLNEIWGKLKAQRLATLGTLTGATAQERWRIATNIEETELTPDDFMAYIMRPTWSRKVAMKVLTKSGLTDEQATLYLQKRPVKANEMFAVYFSGLYTIHYFNLMYRPATANQYKQPPTTFGGNKSSPLAEGKDSASVSPVNFAELPTGPLPDSELKESPVEVPVT